MPRFAVIALVIAATAVPGFAVLFEDDNTDVATAADGSDIPDTSGDDGAGLVTPKSGGTPAATVDYTAQGYYYYSNRYTSIPSGYTGRPAGLSAYELEQLHGECIDRVNMYRNDQLRFSNGYSDYYASNGLTSPVRRHTPNERCVNEATLGALYLNVYANKGTCEHVNINAGVCPYSGGYAQMSCCVEGGPSGLSYSSYSSVRDRMHSCIQRFWDTGANNANGQAYQTMRTYPYLSCGFAYDNQGRLLMNHHYSSGYPGGTYSLCSCAGKYAGQSDGCGGTCVSTGAPQPPPSPPTPPPSPPPSPSGSCSLYQTGKLYYGMADFQYLNNGQIVPMSLMECYSACQNYGGCSHIVYSAQYNYCELWSSSSYSGVSMNSHSAYNIYSCSGSSDTCGGFAGIQCAAGFTCVDDPNDNCNPLTGGADCIGICQPSAPQPSNIIGIALNQGLSTLITAIEAAELTTILSAPGPYTLFAPSNAAFAALPAGELSRLLQPANKAELQALLKLHVVSGQSLSASMLTSGSLTTLGGTVTVYSSGSVYIRGPGNSNYPRVTDADNVASNGIVHVIDALILPAAPPPPPTPTTVVDIAASQGLTTLATALAAADLDTVLAGSGPFTVFGPSNAAFANLPAGELTRLLQPENKVELQNLLKLHVIGASRFSNSFFNGGSVSTLGGVITTYKTNMGLFVYGPGNSAAGTYPLVTSADNVASNGIVHVVNEVILPVATPPPPPPGPYNDCTENYKVFNSACYLCRPADSGCSESGHPQKCGYENGFYKCIIQPTTTTVPPPPALVDASQTATLLGLSTLVTALNAAMIDLSTGGPYTIFAPSNAAFAALPAGELSRLLDPANKIELQNLLQLHVVSGTRLSSSIVNYGSLSSLSGTTLVTYIAGGKVLVAGPGNNSPFPTVTDADNLASNGVIHIIDQVILPAAPPPPPSPPAPFNDCTENNKPLGASCTFCRPLDPACSEIAAVKTCQLNQNNMKVCAVLVTPPSPPPPSPSPPTMGCYIYGPNVQGSVTSITLEYTGSVGSNVHQQGGNAGGYLSGTYDYSTGIEVYADTVKFFSDPYVAKGDKIVLTPYGGFKQWLTIAFDVGGQHKSVYFKTINPYVLQTGNQFGPFRVLGGGQCSAMGPCGAYGCCPSTSIPCTTSSCNNCGCSYSDYGCCANTQVAKYDYSGSNCGCESSTYGCCSDGVTAKNAAGSNCPCAYTTYGCCGSTAVTKSDSYGSNCHCSDSLYGCCPGSNSVRKMDQYGTNCHCSYSTYGCCPGGSSVAKVDNYGSNCGCEYSTYGCCPFSTDYKSDNSGSNCDCSTTTYGCCPSSTVAKSDSAGSNCACGSSIYGCCHNSNLYKNDYSGSNCPCYATQYGCCYNSGYTKADPQGSNCPCSATQYGCCGVSDITKIDSQGSNCPCETTAYGCCGSSSIKKIDVIGSNCPCSTTTYGCCTGTLITKIDNAGSNCPCSSTTYGCCGNSDIAKSDYTGTNCPCDYSQYGCCPDGVTKKTNQYGTNCGCAYSTYGCCGNSTIAKLYKVGYAVGYNCPCDTTQYGCCYGSSVASNSDGSNCPCESSLYGCCGNSDIAKINPAGDNCPCQYSTYGCCGPNNGPKKNDYDGTNCGCQYSTYGCCGDNTTPKYNSQGTNCPCDSTQYGCCYNSGVTSYTQDKSDCPCETTPYGCCKDTSITKVDSQGSNCPCSSTTYGCCPYSTTYAKVDSIGSNCPCQYTTYGCCSGTSIVKANYAGTNCPCSSTYYGCCRDSEIAKVNKYGTNCPCESSTFGCCTGTTIAKSNSYGSNCPCSSTQYGCCEGTEYYRKLSSTWSSSGCPCQYTPFGCCGYSSTPKNDAQGSNCHCSTTTYGCCKNTNIAQIDYQGSNCPCQSTIYGCCGTSNITKTNIYGTNCPCETTIYGCCTNSDIAKKNFQGINCPCETTTYGCCASTTVTSTIPKSDAQGSNCPCQYTLHGCCGASSVTKIDAAGTNCPCSTTTYGCCASYSPIAKIDVIGSNCPCGTTTYGCCTGTDIRKVDFAGSNCPCESTTYGCCGTSNITQIDYIGSNCECLDTLYGCCFGSAIVKKNAQGTNCPCQATVYGCCGNSNIRKYDVEGSNCPCYTTEFGCCKRSTIRAEDPQGSNCPCYTQDYGCCKGTDIAKIDFAGSNCPCGSTLYGCCHNSEIAKEDYFGTNCPCEATVYGCCGNTNIRKTDAFGNNCPCYTKPYGCCGNSSIASNIDGSNCPCSTTQYGCCGFSTIRKTDPQGTNCPCSTRTYGCCYGTTIPKIDAQGSNCDCSDTIYGCCGPNSDIRKVDSIGSNCPCGETEFGCCFNTTVTQRDPLGKTCPCETTLFGCCPEPAPSPPCNPSFTLDLCTKDNPNGKQKINSLTLQYIGGAALTNNQNGKADFSGSVTGSPVSYTARDKDDDIIGSGQVALQGTFTLGSPNGDKFDSETHIQLGGMQIEIHTSCSQTLLPGDIFGALQVVGLTTESGLTSGVTNCPVSNLPPVPGTTPKIDAEGSNCDCSVSEFGCCGTSDIRKLDSAGTNCPCYTYPFGCCGNSETPKIDFTGSNCPCDSTSYSCCPAPYQAIARQDASGSNCPCVPSPSQDACALGKLNSITFQYIGGDSTVTNIQEGKASAFGIAIGNPAPYTIRDKEDDLVGQGSVALQGTFTLGSPNGDKLSSETHIKIGVAPSQIIEVHTSCSKDLNLGDRFGGVVVVGITSEDGGSLSYNQCPTQPILPPCSSFPNGCCGSTNIPKADALGTNCPCGSTPYGCCPGASGSIAKIDFLGSNCFCNPVTNDICGTSYDSRSSSKKSKSSGEKQKINSLTFRYLGGGNTLTNDQEGKAEVSGFVSGSPVSYSGEGFSGTVSTGATFTIGSPGGDKLETDTEIRIGGQTITVHTSCSKPINIGDIYGALELVGFTSTTGSTLQNVCTPPSIPSPSPPPPPPPTTKHQCYFIRDQAISVSGNLGGQSGISLNQCYDLCRQNDLCVIFSFFLNDGSADSCQLFSNAAPKQFYASANTYTYRCDGIVPPPSTPPPQYTCTAMNNYYMNGQAMTGSGYYSGYSMNACLYMCQNTVGCAYASYFSSQQYCAMYTSQSSPVYGQGYMTYRCSYSQANSYQRDRSRRQLEDPADVDYFVQFNSFFVGEADIETMDDVSQDACADACSNNMNCAFFSYFPEGQYCELRSDAFAVEDLQQHTMLTTYIKSIPTEQGALPEIAADAECALYLDYALVEEDSLDGGSGNSSDWTFDMCKEACEGHHQCFSLTYGITNQVEGTGTCDLWGKSKTVEDLVGAPGYNTHMCKFSMSSKPCKRVRGRRIVRQPLGECPDISVTL